MVSYFRLKTPLGPMTLIEEDGCLTGSFFGLRACSGNFVQTAILAQASQELWAYFHGERRTFSLPMRTSGTPFQEAVWKAVGQIPYGATATYQQIANKVGCPRGCRAVGMAVHRNPLAIFLPCHRVVGKDGRLTGYAGGLARKEQLLSLEQSQSTKGGTHYV